jgi:D-3-phosphoglycerate dehydrogenase
VTARRLTVIATGPSGPPEELDPLRRAGHEVVIGRPLDAAGRRAYTEGELIEQCRVADVVLASHLERITPAVMQHAEHLGLVIVPFIGVDKIDVPAATRLGVLVANSPTREN